MNAQDKAEALRLLQIFEPSASEIGAIKKLRALIERQPDDRDGERWRFCLERGFPVGGASWSGWLCRVGPRSFSGKTRVEAVDAAMAAMKEKA